MMSRFHPKRKLSSNLESSLTVVGYRDPTVIKFWARPGPLSHSLAIPKPLWLTGPVFDSLSPEDLLLALNIPPSEPSSRRSRSNHRPPEYMGEELRHQDVHGEEDDEDPPMLSSHTLAALQEFLNEQNRSLAAQAREEPEEEVALVSEDWRLSQFWYDRETAETVASEVLYLCSGSATRIACIACPTLYAYLKKIDPNVAVQLLEYDRRFDQYGSEFTYYDYNQPEEVPPELKHAFDIVVADPPYLSNECLEKVAQTITFLASPECCSLLLLTGEVQRERAAELLGLQPCVFRPQHSSKLGNEFHLFTNYDPGLRLGGWEPKK